MDKYNGFDRVFSRAYLRDGDNLHTGESLMLAMLMHTKGKGRNSKDMNDVLRLMNDRNVNP